MQVDFDIFFIEHFKYKSLGDSARYFCCNWNFEDLAPRDFYRNKQFDYVREPADETDLLV